MQIPTWRNVLFLKNSLKIPALSTTGTNAAPAAAATCGHCIASFHSTPTSCEKWKNKWNADAKRAQQPTKNYIRYQTRHKRADTKRALKDLLFNSGSSKLSFQKEDPIWKFDGKSEWDAERDQKSQRKSSAQRVGKSEPKRRKRKFRRESFCEDFDDPETIFQGKFGNRWYTWTYQSRGEESSFGSSESGFEWREHSNKTHYRTKNWETISDAEADSDDELCDVGSSSDRTILGLPPRGPLKIDDVKNAFRLSALKWHPDKHQGPSQATAEEKFKLCVNAYKSLCDALS
ncbi:DnaJ domain containing protein [Melia azedarach]|uniref:DnaJ domain containing protein n=1 Tax=Melia azedarach TaxID=155640 RepID=A0ACC1XWB9_MELAZ|nr:DnaJ domain containing protein [Melia azedarach]